ncbi:unnamed protein product [Sphagnum jensenii]|uniref:CCDC113/CCDC96 coiled-coil domain-containing protein n=1 Tax=Sphagnum jensenii TaxID=128206 RepID=A0ABP1ATV5_9BRYO
MTTKEDTTRLKAENVDLQRRVWVMRKKQHSFNIEQFFLEGQDAHYQARLKNWSETKKAFDMLKDEYDEKIDNLRERLQDKQNEAHEHHENMVNYIWKIARESSNSVSKRKIPNYQLDVLRQQERDCTLEMQAIRIRGRQLRNQFKKLEHALELKDQLPGGLHLVDFEQLKMENESLNEKIHVKNEDLSNLHKKTTNLVHTLTHIRQKLQFVAQEAKTTGEALTIDDKTLHEGRVKLCEIKATCEAIRHKKDKLQRNVVNISAPTLLADMEYKKDELEIAEENFLQLKSHYYDLQRGIIALNKDYPLLIPHYPYAHQALQNYAHHMHSTLEHDPLRWGSKRIMFGQRMCT